MSRGDVAHRNMLRAAANRCDRTAIETATPFALLEELKRAIDLLQADIPLPEPQQTRLRPMLRVIEGGLSRI